MINLEVKVRAKVHVQCCATNKWWEHCKVAAHSLGSLRLVHLKERLDKNKFYINK